MTVPQDSDNSATGRAPATTRRQFLVRAAALSGAALAAGCSATPGADSTGAGGESIERFLAGAVPDGAGLTALAARGDRIRYCAGVGMADRDGGIRAGRDTVYDIGSVTKQFTAAAILKLETAGILSTTDPLARFVDDVPAGKRGITLHHLLTHTAGLVDQLGDDYAVLSRDELLAGAVGSDPRSAPGTEYHYSNLGYSVLAAVVELASGTGYERYLAANLFGPAGMTRTGHVLPRWDPADIAVEYDPSGTARGRPNERPWDRDGPYWNLRGNGGILSTAPDMFRWHRALRGHDILSASAKRKLFTPHVREGQDESHYGYGWVVLAEDDRTVLWHNGGNGRSYAEIARTVDEGPMVFWATNRVADGKGTNLEEADLTGGIVERLAD